MEKRKLLTVQEASLQIFNGKRSPWSLLQDIKKRRLPAVHLGNRIFLELNSLNTFIDQELEKSISKEGSCIDGICKIE